MKIKKFSAVIISTLLIIQSIIIGISVIAENSEAKLIAHYTFDDAENLGADSEKSHELAINTSTKVVSSDDNGYSGKAVHIGAYNGYDTHLYTDDILESKTDFTVSAFAKLDIGVVNDNHTIFSNGWQNSGGFSFGFSGCEWMYICADVVGGDWIAFNLKQVTNNSDFSAYDWHNYVLSLEKGTILNVYIDGVQVFAQNFAEKLNTTNPESSFVLGSTYNGGYLLMGSIDEVSAYNIALTAQQIKVNYESVVKNPEPAPDPDPNPDTEQDSDGLVAYYAFEKADDLGFDSCEKYPLTIDNLIKDIMISNETGCIGKSVKFSAFNGGYVPFLVNQSDIMDGKSDFTISAYAQLDADAKGENFTIFSNGAWNHGGFTFGFSGKEHFFFHSDSTDWISLNLKNITNKTNFSSRDWHYYTVTVSGGKNLKIYIDGILVYAKTTIMEINTSDPDTQSVFGSTYNGGYPFVGSLDEIKVYYKSLTDERIKEIYEAGGEISDPDPEPSPDPNPEPNPGSENVVAHYSFEKIDDLGYDNCENYPLIISNNAESVISSNDNGSTGKAVHFSSCNDYTTFLTSSNDIIDGKLDITVSAYAQLDANAEGDNFTIFSNGAWNYGGFTFGFAGHEYFFFHSDATDWISLKLKDVTNRAGFNTSEWHNYTVTISSGKNLKIYVDGALIYSLNTSKDINPADSRTPSALGTTYNGGYKLIGSLDEVRFYYAALTAEQIDEFCNVQHEEEKPQVKPAGNSMMAYYTFDDTDDFGADKLSKYNLSIFDNVKKILSNADSAVLDKAMHIDEYSAYDPRLYTRDDLLEARENFTISAYALLDFDGVGENFTIFSNGWQNAGGISFGYAAHDNLYIVADVAGGDWITVNPKQATGNYNFKAHEWHNYTLTLENGRNLKIYIDGEEIFTHTFTAAISTMNSDSPFAIGSTYNGGYGWVGSLDEIKVYDYSLTAAQVKELVKPADKDFENNPSLGGEIIAKYTFDDPERLGYDEVGGNHMVNRGNAVAYADGYKGGSVYFAGIDWQDGLIYNGGDFLKTSEEFTLHFYAKVDGDVADNACVLSTGWDGGNGISMGLRPKNFVFVDSETTANNVIWFAQKSNVTANDGYHAYTYTYSADNLEMAVYVDGNLINTIELGEPLDLKSEFSLTLGQSPWGGYLFKGWVDELVVYDNAFSEERVKELNGITTEKEDSTIIPDDGNDDEDSISSTSNDIETPIDIAEIPDQTADDEVIDEEKGIGTITILIVIASGVFVVMSAGVIIFVVNKKKNS